MKYALSTQTLLLVTLVSVLGTVSSSAQHGKGRGMPPEAQEQIHNLFASHDKIRREVTETDEGYTSLTESDDTKVAAALKKHVSQMEDRLDEGLMVRRWDPAFEEYVRHYKDLDTKFEKTDKGVRMTVKGRTADAVKVARNHAKIVSAFVANGMSEHDVRHPTVTK